MVERIKELCKEKGITIAELERNCGIGNGIIARWKKSKPSFERVAKVADFLGVSPEYLLTGKKENPASVNGDGISEYDVRLLEWFHSLPEEKRRAILEIAGGPKE